MIGKEEKKYDLIFYRNWRITKERKKKENY